LGLKYIPLGGLNPETTEEYLASPLIAACGGSWIAPGKLINADDWATIKANAALATELVKKIRG
jgi:2-dehydro-3-deoxyphosphogluconate aldolase/(4S)-4-hydroxy-2-oxoglutarate aldolase